MTKKKDKDPPVNDEKAHFVVLVRVGGSSPWSRPFVVRAGSLRDAYLDVMEKAHELFQNPSVSLEGYILGLEELPEAKRIARTWWMLAQEYAGGSSSIAARDFEAEWREHGAIDVETEEDA